MAIAELPSTPPADVTPPVPAPPPVDEPDASTSAVGDDAFYARAPEIHDLREVTDVEGFAVVPSSALIVLTEVRGARAAIEAGHQRDVNALAVAGIVALRNALPGLELPYLFRGHGARLLIPGSGREAAERALRGAREFAEAELGLELRTCIVPMAELSAAGEPAQVARQRVSPRLSVAMFAGSAFATAQRWVADSSRSAPFELGAGAARADLRGLECRWQPLPSRRGHVVSLLLVALSKTEPERLRTYRNILRAFDTIVAGDACHPIKKDGLRLLRAWEDRSLESRIAAYTASRPAEPVAGLRTRERSFMERVLRGLRLGRREFDPAKYKRELIDDTDFRRFDDGLQLVVDLSPEELYRFESRLAAEQRTGRLAYGLHSASAALVTCAVRSYDGDHVHFVDGLGGGLCVAAAELEAQLAARRAGRS